MTKNSASKKAARAYMAEHPGMLYTEALRITQAEYAAKRAQTSAPEPVTEGLFSHRASGANG